MSYAPALEVKIIYEYVIIVNPEWLMICLKPGGLSFDCLEYGKLATWRRDKLYFACYETCLWGLFGMFK